MTILSKSITVTLIFFGGLGSIGNAAGPTVDNPPSFPSTTPAANTTNNPTQGQLGDGYTAAMQDNAKYEDNLNFTKNAVNSAATSAGNQSSDTSGGSTETIIYTSEKVPGAICTCAIGADGKTTSYTNAGIEQIKGLAEGESGLNPTCGTISTRKYVCVVSSGLTGFQNIFAQIVKTVVYVVMLLGVLAIVGLGIAWSLAGGDDVKMKSNLKTWGINVLVGLTILFLFRYILTFLAPWIFR